MTFIAAIPYALLVLFGLVLIVAAFNMKRLIGWENRTMTALADAVQNYRETLEEEQRLVTECSTAPKPEAKKSVHNDFWAA